MLEERLTNPVDWVRQNYHTLSNAQKRIADLVIGKGDLAAFMSLKEFAAAAQTTPVTVVKMVKTLGYGSFSEFKKQLQGYLQSVSHPRYVVKDILRDFNEENIQEILERSIEHEIKLVRDTYQFLNRESLLDAANLIKSARVVYLVATAITQPVAETLKLRLQFLHIHAELLDLGNAPLIPARLEAASKEDVFVVFSFPHYMKLIAGIAQCAHLKNSKVICFTDRPIAPPVPHSDIVLFCQSSGMLFYNSMSSALSVVNVLANILLVEVQPAKQSDSKLQEILEKYYPNATYVKGEEFEVGQ